MDIGPFSVVGGTLPWAILVAILTIVLPAIGLKFHQRIANFMNPPKKPAQHTHIHIRQNKAVNIFPSSNEPFTIPEEYPARPSRPQLTTRGRWLDGLRGDSLRCPPEEAIVPAPRRRRGTRTMVENRDYTVY